MNYSKPCSAGFVILRLFCNNFPQDYKSSGAETRMNYLKFKIPTFSLLPSTFYISPPIPYFFCEYHYDPLQSHLLLF